MQQGFSRLLIENKIIHIDDFMGEVPRLKSDGIYLMVNRIKLMPIVYDPTIARDIEQYSERYVDAQYACYLDAEKPEAIEQALVNAAAGSDIDLIVVTDSEAILGIGDWGANGVEISVGKLMVYTAGAGIDPSRVMPVVIDAGTNRPELLDDPLYLGARRKRLADEPYYDFVDAFVRTAERLFPHLYLHFEDFGRGHAARSRP